KTFSPLTSNSVTSAAALSATALTFSVSGWPGCPGFGCDTLGASLPFVASCARPTKLGAYVNPVLSTNAKLKIQLLINFRISFIALLNLLPDCFAPCGLLLNVLCSLVSAADQIRLRPLRCL